MREQAPAKEAVAGRELMLCPLKQGRVRVTGAGLSTDPPQVTLSSPCLVRGQGGVGKLVALGNSPSFLSTRDLIYIMLEGLAQNLPVR